MKKVYILGIVSLLALSLLVVGCGSTDKASTTEDKPKTEQSHENMENMDHSKMDTGDQKSDNKQ